MEMITTKSEDKSDNAALSAGVIYYLTGGLLGRGTQILGQIVLARILTIHAFGLYALGWTIFRIASLFFPIGLHNGVIRFATPEWPHNKERVKEIISQTLAMSLIISVVLTILFVISTPWLSHQVFNEPDLAPVLYGMAIAIPFTAVLKVASAATRISKKTQYSVLSEEFAPTTIQFILICVFAALGWKLGGAIVATIIGFGTAFLLSLYYLRKIFGNFSRPRRPIFDRTIVAYSIPTSLIGSLMFLSVRIDRISIGIFDDADGVGVYQAMSQIPIIFPYILLAFNAIFTPFVADLFPRGEMTRLNALFKTSTRWSLYLSFLPFLMIVTMPEDILAVLFGPKFVVAAAPLLVLAAGQLFNAGTGAVGSVLTMTGYQHLFLWLTIISLVINIVLNILLIPSMAITGAAVATTASIVFLFTACIISVYKIHGLWPYDLKYGKGVLAAIGATVSGIVFHGALSQLPLEIDVVLTCLVITGVYAFILYVLGLEEEDLEMLATVKNRLNRAR